MTAEDMERLLDEVFADLGLEQVGYGPRMQTRSDRLKGNTNHPGARLLARLTLKERHDYDALRAARYTRAEALKAIGRADLLAEIEP